MLVKAIPAAETRAPVGGNFAKRRLQKREHTHRSVMLPTSPCSHIFTSLHPYAKSTHYTLHSFSGNARANSSVQNIKKSKFSPVDISSPTITRPLNLHNVNSYCSSLQRACRCHNVRDGLTTTIASRRFSWHTTSADLCGLTAFVAASPLCRNGCPGMLAPTLGSVTTLADYFIG